MKKFIAIITDSEIRARFSEAVAELERNNQIRFPDSQARADFISCRFCLERKAPLHFPYLFYQKLLLLSNQRVWNDPIVITRVRVKEKLGAIFGLQLRNLHIFSFLSWWGIGLCLISL